MHACMHSGTNTFGSVRGLQGVAIDALRKRGAIEELHLRVLAFLQVRIHEGWTNT